ncbi:hypothetical protein CK623_06405 [Vandammella animalimorsus]|uniref:IPTL-CTERM protein sorting domain-containing protein n=1 Tax=Vandammella animalimorsus TaxID=2029117 RepID=A0A2A2ARD6_9BURK|nr:IPTL-CTERM sorting domain-containing protein [Vandammella animalimorsus]PAT40313.1 hypothetical protein CK623_06405 [Vandammella animalimorsus]
MGRPGHLAGRWLAGAALALGAVGAAQAQQVWPLDPTFHYSKTPQNQYAAFDLIERDGKLWTTSHTDVVRLEASSGNWQLMQRGNNDVYALALQADGKLLAAGGFTEFPTGQPASRIVRLNADGARDASFSPPSAINDWVRDLAVQADGKILLGGDFSQVGGTAAQGLARLNADGSRDPGFTSALPAGAKVFALLPLPGGQVLAGSIGGISGGGSNLNRLNADGSLANAGLAKPNGGVDVLHRLKNGQILVGGGFTEVDGQPYRRLARLNADGSLDASFPNPAITGGVFALHELPNGQILVGGRFTQIHGQAREHLALLNADGTLDASFSAPTVTLDVGSPDNRSILSFKEQADGKLLVGGNFSMEEGGQQRQGVVRLVPPTGSGPHAIVTASVTGGHGAVAPASRTVNVGQPATFTLTPDAGYQPSASVGGTCAAGSFSGNDYTVPNVNADCTVQFRFEAIAATTATVTASVTGGHGAVAPASRTVNVGQPATFTLTPDVGYQPSASVGGTCAAGSFSGNDYTVPNVSADCALEFRFQASPPGTPPSSGVTPVPTLGHWALMLLGLLAAALGMQRLRRA